MKLNTTRSKITTLTIYIVGFVLCSAIAYNMWHRVIGAVNNSYLTYEYNHESSLDTRLNHANTYYWYARYRKNSQPEFERAQQIAQQVINEITDSIKAYPEHAVEYQSLANQAKTLNSYCVEQGAVSQLNIASYVPMYLEMMAHDEAFMEQDCEDEEVETRAANRAIDVILDLTSPEKNAKIGERPLFALVRAQGEPKAIHESIIQKLNAESKFYTISDHELVKVLGNGATYESVFSDSTSLVRVADFFGAKSIALIELINNDKVDGIHYYGMRYNVWQQGDNGIKDGVYTEYFLRNRNFNQMTIMKIPLFLMFVGLIGALGFAIALVFALVKSAHFAWYSFWISLAGATLAIIGIIDYLYMEFLNPLPSDYYATDAGENWQISLPIAILVIPVFINYIILGRLDKHISSFQSRLDESWGLFVLFAGGFTAIPLIWANYRIMRFGIELSTIDTLLYAVALFATYGFSLSRWAHKVLDFPQKVGWRRRGLAYFMVTLFVYFAYGTTVELIIGSSIKINWIFVLTVGFLPLLVEFIYNKVPTKALESIAPEETKPVNIEHLSLSINKWDLYGKQSTVIKVVASKSLNPASFVILGANVQSLEWHVIDFSTRGDGKTHHFPFASALAHLFTFKRFNDVAEQSRIIGNLLGKLISTVSSVGEYLIDESDPKPRKANEVATMIYSELVKSNYGLILQHPEKAAEEDLELLNALLSKLATSDTPPPIAFCEGAAYSLQQEFQASLEQYCAGLGEEHLEFTVSFKNLAQSIMEQRGIEPMTRVLVEERLIASELDQSPALARSAVDQLMASPQVFKNEFGQFQLKSAQFEFAQAVQSNSAIVDLDFAHRELLVCAAIAANESGIFNLDLVTALAGITRKEVLAQLDHLQSAHVLIDLKDDEHLDLYQFSDIETIKELRSEDEHDNDNISQHIRELYRTYVAFFLPHSSWEESKAHLESCLQRKLISERELTFLAIRALRVNSVSSLDDVLDFVLSKTVSEGLTANFDGATQLIHRIKTNSKLKSTRVDWHEFVLCVETGAYNNARQLYEAGIKERALKHDLSNAELLVCVRYCFGDFMHSDNADHCKKLNEYILQSNRSDVLDKLRSTFYRTKLISNNSKKLNNLANKSNVELVIQTYKELEIALGELVNVENAEPRALNLYKEVLNDFLCYHSDFMWPESQTMREFGLDLLESIEKFEQLKWQRLKLEQVDSTNWLDPSWVQRGTEIDYRGLCFTYNYIQRGYHNLEKFEASIKAGQMSFTLNSFVGDHNGKQVCAGYLSKAYISVSNLESGLYWAQQSAAYANTHGLYTGNALDTLANACEANKNNFTSLHQLSQSISSRHLVKHFDEQMPTIVKKQLLLNGAEMLRAQTEVGSRFFWDKPISLSYLFELVEHLQSIKDEDAVSLVFKGTEIQIEKSSVGFGKIEFNLLFPESIGLTNVIPIEPEHQPKPITRGGSEVWIIEGAKPIETNQCALIVQEVHPGAPWHLITAHPGHCAPPLPKGSVSLDPTGFWNTHAFVG